MKYFLGKTEITEQEWLKIKKRIPVDLSNIHTNIVKSAMDIEIEKKGAIIDNMGNPHTTAQSYKNYLKNSGLVIRDWTEGTNNQRDYKHCENSDVLTAMKHLNI
jgi:adenylate kinase family enzyme